MAIIKLTPSCKDYLWGGSRLRTDFGVQSDLDPLAEAWVLSCHPDGPSYLPNGTTLADYAAAHPEALGTDCAKFEQFPVLIKFIDARNNLSIPPSCCARPLCRLKAPLGLSLLRKRGLVEKYRTARIYSP